MPITEADYPKIRRLEAVGFRSLPAKNVHFNGSWAVRLTPHTNTKRLNSINPLDPADTENFEKRLHLEKNRFQTLGKPPIFRLTPLASPVLTNYLTGLGWISFEESLLMTLNLDELDLQNVEDQLPIQDTRQWVQASLHLQNKNLDTLPNTVEMLNSIKTLSGLFLTQIVETSPPVLCSVLRCVINQELAGLFSLATNNQFQRQGFARKITLGSLLWAKRNGAKLVWLQVVADNFPAVSLYQSLGFREFYRYTYYKLPST